MEIYLDLIFTLNFAVDYVLLRAAASLTGPPPSRWRMIVAAGLGAGYAGMCALPGFRFLNFALWRVIFGAAMAVIAFGISRGAFRRAAVFLCLSLALGGLALCLRLRSFWAILLAAGVLLLTCRVFLRGAMTSAGQLVPVSIRLGDRQVHLTALRDSGNTLCDPVSGQSVLVAQAETAQALLPWNLDLQNPAQAMAGLHRQAPELCCRLIPYRSVGGDGLLLAVRCDAVTVGNHPSGHLVAFAPTAISSDGTYQALTGGGQYG